MSEKKFSKVERGYSRSQEKHFTQVLIDDFFDPEIADAHVAGGDPGLAQLMRAALDELRAEGMVPDADPDD